MTPPINQWPKGTLEWYDACDNCPDFTCPGRAVGQACDSQIVRLSVPFTWNLRRAFQRAAWLKTQGYTVLAGGPAVNLMPDFLAPVAQVGDDWPGAMQKHNPHATQTSRGCVQACPYCSVPKTEGEFRELDDWPVAPIVCDNNILASSRRHFDRVIDSLKPITHFGIDFNQGLDPRLLTRYQAGRLAELGCTARLSLNHTHLETVFLRAFEYLRDAGFPKHSITCYVLIGYDDTPDDALYRLRLVQSLGIKPFPCRYQPLDALVKNCYVHPNWTDEELTRFLRYWCRLPYFSHIPFEEFDNTARRSRPHTMPVGAGSLSSETGARPPTIGGPLT